MATIQLFVPSVPTHGTRWFSARVVAATYVVVWVLASLLWRVLIPAAWLAALIAGGGAV